MGSQRDTLPFMYSMVWMVRGIILKNKLFSFKEDADEKYELFPNWNWNQQNWETRGQNKIGRQGDSTKLGDRGIDQNWETRGQNKIGRHGDRTKLGDKGIEQNWETRGRSRQKE